MAFGERVVSSSSSSLAALLLLLLLLQQQQQISAFQAPAHEAISMTALSGLTLQANQALRRLLNGKDVADVSASACGYIVASVATAAVARADVAAAAAAPPPPPPPPPPSAPPAAAGAAGCWAHRVTEKYPLTAPLHFQRQPGCPTPPPLAAQTKIERSLCSSPEASEKGCLLEALTYFFYRLTAPDKNKEDRDDTNPVIKTSEFVFPHGITTTDADSVKYVINLIGDMHEPLHWGSADDDFGRQIQVEFEDGDGAREVKRTSLYEFIEGAFIQKVMKERQSFWYSGWTHVNSVKSFYEEEKAVFAARKESYFMAWARENRAILCSEIYPLLSRMTKKKGETNVYVLDRTSEFLFFEIIKKRILVAGARVAVVMNYILQVRGLDEGLGQLRAGSGIQDVQETADAKLPSSGDTYVISR
ncbi:hypothetical protein Emed_005528 [Eimeria media]